MTDRGQSVDLERQMSTQVNKPLKDVSSLWPSPVDLSGWDLRHRIILMLAQRA